MKTRASTGPATAGPVLALVFIALESSARLAPTVAEFGLGPRLTLAATAPFVYLWRTVWPVRLTPLDPLALTPHTDVMLVLVGFTALGVVSAAAWRWRREAPVLSLAWLAYLALLAPAIGLVPSGLQATADRYTYLAAVPVSIAAAMAMTAATKVAALQVAALQGAALQGAALRGAALRAAGYVPPSDGDPSGARRLQTRQRTSVARRLQTRRSRLRSPQRS
jgi:hypothetical protein